MAKPAQNGIKEKVSTLTIISTTNRTSHWKILQKIARNELGEGAQFAPNL